MKHLEILPTYSDREAKGDGALEVCLYLEGLHL